MAGDYPAPEIAQLAFEGSPPDAHALAVTWRTVLEQAAAIIDELPDQQAGTCVLDARGGLFRGDPPALKRALRRTPSASMKDRSAARTRVCWTEHGTPNGSPGLGQARPREVRPAVAHGSSCKKAPSVMRRMPKAVMGSAHEPEVVEIGAAAQRIGQDVVYLNQMS